MAKLNLPGYRLALRSIGGLLCLLLCLVVTAEAQTDTPAPPALSGNLTDAEFREMLGRLSDEQVRDILIREFAARRAPKPESEGGLLGNARNVGEELSANARTLLSKWPQMSTAVGAVSNRLAEAGGVGLALLAMLISFAFGFLARHFWRRKAAERQMKLTERNINKGAYATIGTIGDAFLFLLIDLSSALIFALAALAALYLFFHNPDIRIFVSSFVAFVTVLLIMRSIVGWMFPQNWPVYRMVAISDSATRLLHWAVVGLAALWALSSSTAEVMLRFGAPEGTPELMALVVSTLWLAIAVGSIYRLHRQTADLLPPREDPGLANAMTRSWAVVMTAAILAIWLLYVGGGLLSGAADAAASANLTLLAVIFGFWAIYRILTLYLRAQSLANEIKAAIRRAASAALVAVGVMIFLAVWGLDPATLEASGFTGRWFQAAVNVGLTALIGWAIWDFIRTLIDLRLANERPAEAADEGGDEGGLGASRTATLLPLLRSFALAAIGLTCVFTALSSLGVNVAPLIAGAGVVGLAIGFGAQTLVKDVVSGVFFLIDDAFRRGEYIDLGTVKGTVERISVRSLQLRHQLGAVHTIPFGDIAALTNYSRDWVIMKLPLRLTFDTDPQVVKKIIKRIGAEMMEDETLGPGFLEPPKSQGVIQMEDSAMILRVKFKAIPGKQFVIRRELLHRVRAAFEEAGIRFANREVTVRVDEGAGQSERVQAAGAAATRTVESEQPAQ